MFKFVPTRIRLSITVMDPSTWDPGSIITALVTPDQNLTETLPQGKAEDYRHALEISKPTIPRCLLTLITFKQAKSSASIIDLLSKTIVYVSVCLLIFNPTFS